MENRLAVFVSIGAIVRMRRRLSLALVAAGATALLFAEGVLKNGWIEVVLLAPVVLFLFLSDPPAWTENLVLSLTALCLAMSVADLLLRPVLGPRLHYTPTNLFARKLPRLPIVGRWDPNVTFSGEVYGDLAALLEDPALREPRRIDFRTDEAGFRNERGLKPIDLVVLGDSFAAGAGTSQDKIFARVLEARCGRSVYNLAYPGGPYDQFVNFAIEWPRLPIAPQTTLVWTLYTGNDLDDAGGEVWDLSALPWREGAGEWIVRYRTFRNRSPLNQLMEGWRARWSGAAGGVVVRRQPDGRPVLFLSSHEVWGMKSRADVERHANFPKLERTFAAMQALAGARGVPVVLLILPTKGEIYRWLLAQRPSAQWEAGPSGFAQAVLASCERAQLRCLDARPYLVEEARRTFETTGDLLWWRDDTHPNEHGHRAIAELIARDVLGMAGCATRE